MATRKIRTKSAPQADTSSNLYVQPGDTVEAIVELPDGNVVISEPMQARDVPREGDNIEFE